MISRADRRHLEQALRAAVRAEFTPVLARLDAVQAAIEVHIQYPAVFVDWAAPDGDRTAVLRQLHDAVGGVTHSIVTVMGRTARPPGARAPRRRREPAAETAAEVSPPAAVEMPPAPLPEPAPQEPPARSSEDLMREWLVQELRRDRLGEAEIERRMDAAETKHLFAAANARRTKRGLPPFEMPA